MDLDGVDPGGQGLARRPDELVDQPSDLVGVEGVGDRVVEVATEGGGRARGHAALLHHLARHDRTFGVEYVDEASHPVAEAIGPEEAGPMGADAGGLEAGRHRVGDEDGRPAEPLHAARRLAPPHLAELFELGLGADELGVSAPVWWDHDPSVELQGADRDRREDRRQACGGGRLARRRHEGEDTQVRLQFLAVNRRHP